MSSELRRSDRLVTLALRIRVVAVLLALLVLTALYGEPDLYAVFSPGYFRPAIMLSAGWGLLLTVLVAGSFLAVGVAPYRCTPPIVQVSAVVVALLAGAVFGAN